MFAEVVERRDSETLLDVISRHVAEGSIIHTDIWGGYSRLEEVLNVERRTVNHSQHFVNPVDGTHTNTIEGIWNGIKLEVALGIALKRRWMVISWNSSGEGSIQKIFGIALFQHLVMYSHGTKVFVHFTQNFSQQFQLNFKTFQRPEILTQLINT